MAAGQRPPARGTVVSAPLPAAPAEATIELLQRIRRGDAEAMNRLLSRCMPVMMRWARGRLPAAARDVLETQDLVQETIVRALPHLEDFEYRHEGALYAYLRQAIANRLRDEARRVARRPRAEPLADDRPGHDASPLERAIGREEIERYEAALEALRPLDRQAIVLRFELQQSYAEIAAALGRPGAEAARMVVTRAVARLLEEMSHEA